MLGEEGKEIGFCRFISRARFGSGGDGLIGVLELIRIELQTL